MKRNQFNIVLMFRDIANNKIIDNDHLLKFFEDNKDIISYYSYILHNDTDKLHYHIMIETRSNLAKNTIINMFAKQLKCNRDIVQVLYAIDFVKENRYLLHIDDGDKEPYLLNDVSSNDIDRFTDMIDKNIDINSITIEYLINIVNSSDTLIQCYSKLGLGLSSKYRNIICDLWKCKY